MLEWWLLTTCIMCFSYTSPQQFFLNDIIFFKTFQKWFSKVALIVYTSVGSTHIDYFHVQTPSQLHQIMIAIIKTLINILHLKSLGLVMPPCNILFTIHLFSHLHVKKELSPSLTPSKHKAKKGETILYKKKKNPYYKGFSFLEW